MNYPNNLIFIIDSFNQVGKFANLVFEYMRFTVLIILILFSVSCQKDDEVNPVDNPYVYSGGSNTVFDKSTNAFGFPNPNLSSSDELLFYVGNSFFKQSWVTAPSSTTARDGLGPLFNSRSCSSCHGKDGRGFPKENGHSESAGFLVRVSLSGQTDAHGGPMPHPTYGGQLQEESTLSDGGEATVSVSYTYETVYYDDGTSKTLRRPTYSITDKNGQPITGVDFSPRIGQQIIGLGLLEAISEADILSYQSSVEASIQQVTGRANYVYNVETNQNEIGRFGWKANQPTLRQQVAGALNGDLGITSSIFPNENFTQDETDYISLPNGGTPEIEDDDFDKLVLYTANLAVPARRDYDNEDVIEGQKMFNIVGCSACHRSSYTTDQHETFPSLSDQKIYPYTDLLLHDMGPDLADQRADYLANGQEWRTPPLWGIGLVETVNGHTYFLHDGRARDLEEAILWHGGEAERVIESFKSLELEKRQQIIKFLKSL